jgi:hypothetical protein
VNAAHLFAHLFESYGIMSRGDEFASW